MASQNTYDMCYMTSGLAIRYMLSEIWSMICYNIVLTYLLVSQTLNGEFICPEGTYVRGFKNGVSICEDVSSNATFVSGVSPAIENKSNIEKELKAEGIRIKLCLIAGIWISELGLKFDFV